MSDDQLMNLNVPASFEAEAAVLGGLLVNPDAIIEVRALPLVPNDFFLVKHRLIYGAMVNLHDRRAPIDVLTLFEELRSRNELGQVGELPYLTHLLNVMPSGVNAPYYGEIVRRASIRRRAMQAADIIKSMALDEKNIDTDTLTARAVELLSALMPSDSRRTITLSDALDIQINVVLDYIDNPHKQRPGLPSSIPTLDKLVGGWQPQQLVVFGGRPGMGKSSLLLGEALNMAKYVPVGVFSLEMSIPQMTNRAMEIVHGINVKRDLIDNPNPSAALMKRYMQAAEELKQRPIILEDITGLTPLKLLAKARSMQARYGCQAFAVDYLQLMKPDGKIGNMTRQQVLGQIAEGLKSAAKELFAPIITAAQVGRDTDKRENKRPVLSDLRESGDIENNADVVVLIHRPDYHDSGREKQDNEPAELILAKHREGETRNIQVFWQKHNVRFTEASNRDEALQPNRVVNAGRDANASPF